MQTAENPYLTEFAEKITDQVIEVLTAAKILLEAVSQINQGKDVTDPNVIVQLEFVDKTKLFAKAYKTFEKGIKSDFSTIDTTSAFAHTLFDFAKKVQSFSRPKTEEPPVQGFLKASKRLLGTLGLIKNKQKGGNSSNGSLLNPQPSNTQTPNTSTTSSQNPSESKARTTRSYTDLIKNSPKSPLQNGAQNTQDNQSTQHPNPVSAPKPTNIQPSEDLESKHKKIQELDKRMQDKEKLKDEMDKIIQEETGSEKKKQENERKKTLAKLEIQRSQRIKEEEEIKKEEDEKKNKVHFANVNEKEKPSVETETNGKTGSCNRCEDAVSSHFCVDCKKRYCGECVVEVHSMGRWINHFYYELGSSMSTLPPRALKNSDDNSTIVPTPSAIIETGVRRDSIDTSPVTPVTTNTPSSPPVSPNTWRRATEPSKNVTLNAPPPPTKSLVQQVFDNMEDEKRTSVEKELMVSFTQPVEEKSSSSFIRGSIQKIEKNLIDFVLDQIRTELKTEVIDIQESRLIDILEIVISEVPRLKETFQKKILSQIFELFKGELTLIEKKREKAGVNAYKLAGHYYKMGGVQKNWKDRWFVVTETGITYYKNRQDFGDKITKGKNIQPKGTIPFSSICNVTNCGTVVCQKPAIKHESRPSRGSHCLHIETMFDRTYHLVGFKENEVQQWLNSLKGVLKVHVIKRAITKWLQTYAFEMKKAAPVNVEEIVQVLAILKLDRYLPKDEEEEKRWSIQANETPTEHNGVQS